MFGAPNGHCEISGQTRVVCAGAIGDMRESARRPGLLGEIEGELRLLKVCLPYHESDHVLNSQRSETPTAGSRGCASTEERG